LISFLNLLAARVMAFLYRREDELAIVKKIITIYTAIL